MLKRRIIVCLDLRDGRVVKGVRFRRLRDCGDPVELALRYQQQGADEIVLLDISATTQGRGHALDTVRRVRTRLSLPLTVGGGVRSVADARALLQAGADKVAVNSAAAARPALVHEMAVSFGRQCTVVAVDAGRRRTGEGGPEFRTIVRSGLERTPMDAVAWCAEAQRRGAGEILLTSWDSDGVGEGYDTALLTSVCAVVNIPVIASGGAGCPIHLVEAFRSGAHAVLAASIFHDGLYHIDTIKTELRAAGIELRTT